MKVGRPQKFHADTALEAAIDEFWRRGYDGTSVQNLLDAMGINRGSMYNSFGDKQSLFVMAVEHYCARQRETVSGVLKQSGSPLENVRRWLRSRATQSHSGTIRGCLVTNTAVETSPHIPEIADTLTYHLSWLERTLRNALDRAVDSEELSHLTDTRSLARFLVSTDQGIMVMGRAGAAPESVEEIVAVALAVLDAAR